MNKVKISKMKKRIKNVLIEAFAWIVVFLIIIAILKYIIYG